MKLNQNKWIGIQVKSTEKNNQYEFHLENNYSDLIMLCICEDDKKIWLIPYEDINGVSKIHIGIKKVVKIIKNKEIPSIPKTKFNVENDNSPGNIDENRV